MRYVIRGVIAGLVLISAFSATMCAVHKTPVDQDETAIRLEIRPARETPAEGFSPADNPYSNKVLYVSNEVVISNVHITNARPIENNGRFGVAFDFTKEGGQRMAEFTRGHMNQRAAILLDGKVITAPVIKGVISKRAMIEGNYTPAEAKRIARALMRR